MTPTQRAKRAHRRGKDFERQIRDYARKKGFDYEQLRQTGTRDEGDGYFILKDGLRVVVEAKNTERLDLSGHLAEAKSEAEHFAQHRDHPEINTIPVVFQKRRGKGTGKSYAVLEMDDFLNVLERLR